MKIELIKQTIWFVAFALLQAMVLGRIHLFGVATPLLYVYFVLQFPRNYPKWASLLWSFSLGLLVDVFMNTPGLAATSLTLVAAIQPYYFELFVPRDSVENLQPSMAALGMMRFSYYVIPLVLFFCLVFYLLELFTFFNIVFWLICSLSSAALTLMIIYALEIAKNRNKKDGDRR